MTESTDSINNNEVTEEDIKKLTQKISGAKTQDVLKAISSESESARLSGSKLSNQFAIGSYSSKHSKPGSNDVLHDNVDNSLSSNAESNKCPFTTDNPYTGCKGNSEPPMDSLRTDPVVMGNKSSFTCTQQPTSPVQPDVVPESMFSVLQQKAQNVLKMIAIENEARTPEVTFPQANDKGTLGQSQSLDSQDSEANYQHTNDKGILGQSRSTDSKVPEVIFPHKYEQSLINQSLSTNDPSLASSHQSILKKSTESANLKNSKTSSYQSSSNLSEVKSYNKYETSLIDGKKSSTVKQPDNVIRNISYTSVPQQHLPVVEDISANFHSKQCCRTSESQQSNRSTEECTTDYSLKNNSGSENVLPKEPDDIQKTECPQTGILSQQCTTIGENILLNVPLLNEIGHDLNQPANEVIKELSQIITSNEMPVRLTRQGELISQLFKQKFIVKLEANGKLDEHSAEIASVTATKFAKWMEDILKEIDTRKKITSDSQKTPLNDLKDIKEEKEHEDEFVSAASSKESVTNKEDLAQVNQTDVPPVKTQDESPEVIKIQELSDSELVEKYGGHLLRDSKYELFQFIGPDNIPVEVRHLTTVESKKVMVVKKKTSENQWSNWVIEVGPEVTLESVSGSVLQKVEKEDTENKLKALDAGIWNVKKFPWDIFTPKVTQRKIPILKKQCVLTEADFGVEYPAYPFIAAQFEKAAIDSSRIMKSHQAEPSPNFQ